MIKQINRQQKIYFIYFIIISVIVMLIFGYAIFRFFWDYQSEIKKMENYYSGRLLDLSKKTPTINRFDPINGNNNAKVTIFVYLDFFCPACQNIQNDVSSVQKLYGNNIRTIYKILPITNNPNNLPAGNAVYCAWEQNQFENYKNLLYQNNQTLSTQKYKEFAANLELDLNTFNNCLDSNKYYPVIQQNLEEALNLNVTSVPTIYVNNEKTEGVININTLKSLIDKKFVE